MTKPNSQDSMARLAEIAASYRQAFDEVQQLVAESGDGEVPSWVFAVDRLTPSHLDDLPAAIVTAELRRRRWKAALHAMAEWVALEQDHALPSHVPSEDALDALGHMEEEDRQRLDRFISVLSCARLGGCIYVNGTFQPVEGKRG